MPGTIGFIGLGVMGEPICRNLARKDLGYALDLARSVGIKLEGAELADRLLGQAVDEGFGDLYWPVLSRVVAASRCRPETGAA